MERHTVDVTVYVDMPGGSAPGIPVGNTAKQKIKKAIQIVFDAGLVPNKFSISAMDTVDNDVIGMVLTHDDA